MVDRARRIKWTEQQVVNCYNELHSSNKVAEKLKIGQSTVLRILMKSNVQTDGLERYRTDARAFDPETDKKIVAAYKAGAWSADLAREYGVTIYTIKQALKREGCPLRPNPSTLLRDGEAEQILKMYAYGASQMQISIAIERSQQFVGRVLRKHGIVHQVRSRENHGQWKGGRNLAAGGYWRVLVDDDDPLASMANYKGYVLEHRLVMARHLGRPLRPSETVHHVNGNPSDNRLENLQLRQGKHGKGTAMHCLDCGSHRIGYVQLKDIH